MDMHGATGGEHGQAGRRRVQGIEPEHPRGNTGKDDCIGTYVTAMQGVVLNTTAGLMITAAHRTKTSQKLTNVQLNSPISGQNANVHIFPNTFQWLS